MRALAFLSSFLSIVAATTLTGNSSIPSFGSGSCLSGGQCTSVLMATGWFRSAVLNPDVAMLLVGTAAHPALAASTASGGTMFWTRFLVLRNFKSASKFKYPCFMLASAYRKICNFHQDYGGIANICDAEFWGVVEFAITLVYTPLFNSYGGNFGVAASFSFVYFPFISNLPLIKEASSNYGIFNRQYDLIPTARGVTSWIVGITRVSPKEANAFQPYNYGIQSWLSRGYSSLVPAKRGVPFWLNYTLGSICSQSAFFLAGLSAIPFALAGKTWDSTGGASNSALKTMLIGLSFVMMRRLLTKHMLKSSPEAPACGDSCAVMDAGLSDSGPLAPALSYATSDGSSRISYVQMVGPSSTLNLYKYYMGMSELEIWAGAGWNLCPFPQLTTCAALRTAKDIMKANLNTGMLKKYQDVVSTYGAFLPEYQIMAPMCGDPLIADMFLSTCHAASVCSLAATAVPNKVLQVEFTPEPFHFALSNVFIGATSLSKSFCAEYVPVELLKLPYFSHMASWFPSFNIMAKEKGGWAYVRAAGHPLQDYLTYLSFRVSSKIRSAMTEASFIKSGEGKSTYDCSYKEFTDLSIASRQERDFALDLASHGLGPVA